MKKKTAKTRYVKQVDTGYVFIATPALVLKKEFVPIPAAEAARRLKAQQAGNSAGFEKQKDTRKKTGRKA